MSKTMTILGVDPGTNFMGYAILNIRSEEAICNRIGVLKMKRYATQQEKLKHIYKRIQELVKSYKPDHMAIEAPFFGKNVQSMLKLGRAQGVAIAAAMSADVPTSEYSPKKIKLAITGNGNASKQQVHGMLGQLVKMKKSPESLDASDALAAALCHYYQLDSPISGGKQYSSWSDFIKSNPDKVK
jgi:crossover junction endodeoxyribonuclease RuvC